MNVSRPRIRYCKSPMGMLAEADYFPDVGVVERPCPRQSLLRATSGSPMVKMMAESTYDDLT
jgi:hypothetical protein